MITYSRTPVIPETSFVLKRTLPKQGEVLVKVGQIVRPEEIVAEGRRSSGFRTFELDKILGVTPAQALGLLRKTIGSRVFEGEPIVERKRFWGLKTIRFLSPMSGILKDYNPQNGQLTIEYLPEVVKIAAGVEGKIVEIYDRRRVDILACVAEVLGVLGSGKQREGAIKVVANLDIPVPPSSIDATLEGKIVVGGAQVSLDTIYRSLAVKVKGIICGGINFSDYQKLTGSLGRYEDIGLTLLITEGFGRIPMQKRIFELLKKYEDCYSLIFGSKHLLVVPLSLPGKEPLAKFPKQKNFARLKKGDSVRILTAPYLGIEGIIDKIEESLVEQESGIMCQTVKVKIGEGKTVEVPVRNVEIIR